MGALAGPFFAAAGLLVCAGFLKARRPDATARALGGIGLPASTATARALGAVEVGIGASALLWASSVTAVLVGGCYVAFAAFLALARPAPVPGCGCFGSADDPPSIVHLVVTLSAAVVAVSTAVGRSDSLPGVVADQPLWGLPFLALTGATVWLAVLALTVLPRTLAMTAVAHVSEPQASEPMSTVPRSAGQPPKGGGRGALTATLNDTLATLTVDG